MLINGRHMTPRLHFVLKLCVYWAELAFDFLFRSALRYGAPREFNSQFRFAHAYLLITAIWCRGRRMLRYYYLDFDACVPADFIISAMRYRFTFIDCRFHFAMAKCFNTNIFILHSAFWLLFPYTRNEWRISRKYRNITRLSPCSLISANTPRTVSHYI